MQCETVIGATDTEGWKNYFACFKAMLAEIRALTIPAVDGILDKYACKEVDYGNGLNIDWPDSKPAEETPASVNPSPGESSQEVAPHE